jgi:hypothetical protein
MGGPTGTKVSLELGTKEGYRHEYACVDTLLPVSNWESICIARR